ncbi:hypothetical protein DQ04_00401100 [Trypanosoma grayi]|uniref:hypothetical protein n=1 Tax=Trypanosoma grayi TaxID=71804 RepID=UPI0004F4293D|nr:hypothetical protein DQ04_00401100 [Trypanosoma grayi]KEG14570.1 hypothetical protein DQ04_00401100 [Trypanosoma grayi]
MWKGLPKKNISDLDKGDGDDGYLLTALRELYFKLLGAQPEFTEEDVVIMPYPSPGSSPTHSPGSSPRDWEAERDHDEPASLARGESNPRQHNALSSSRGEESLYSQTVAVDLDEPMTSRQFLTTVNKFEAKSVLRNRRTAGDALKLLNHGYALTWRDTGHFSNTTVRGYRGSSRPMAPNTRDFRWRSNTATTATLRRCLFTPSLFSIPSHKPAEKLVALMSKCVEALLVYANESPSLRTLVTSNVMLLRLLCFICVEARRLEASLQRDAWRDIDAELNELASHWRAFPATLPFIGTLQECYLMEYLLDVALPPAVCSMRYDGIAMTLYQKKERLMMDMVSSRSGFGNMTKGLPLRGLAALVSMSTFTEPRLRARALDRMTGEGLVLTLREEMCGATKETVRALTSVKSGRQNPSKKGPSPSSLRLTPRGVGGVFASSQLRPKRARSEGGLLDVQESPWRRLGYCLDILQWLTAPNLAHEIPSTSATTTKGVVRATAWASQTDDVRGICACLLRLSSIKVHNSPSPYPHPFQEQALECVRQIASYSAVLYGIVVEALDDVFDECSEGRAHGQDDYTALLLPLLVELLQLKQHAEANEECIRRWFTWLAECLVPQVFDVPVLTCNRENGNTTWPRKGRGKLSSIRCEAPVLARDLRRDEIISLSPYFNFASRLINETSWRCGAESFLAKIALLAYNVVLSQARRPNLIFGQASACYDVVAPLLQTPHGVLPGEVTAGPLESFRTPARRGSKTLHKSLETPSSGKKWGRSHSQGSADGGEEVFIPSPSQSPLFLEAYSPSTPDAERRRESDDLPSVEASPSCGVTVSSWRRRLSLSAFLAAIGEYYRD